MATNIPPHNLAEVCNAALKLIDKPDATLAELMRIVKGPDFPTGGAHHGRRRHQGRVPHRPGHRPGARPCRDRRRASAAARRSCSPRCPFQTSVDAIAGKLAELVESGKIDGVRDIRNESGRARPGS